MYCKYNSITSRVTTYIAAKFLSDYTAISLYLRNYTYAPSSRFVSHNARNGTKIVPKTHEMGTNTRNGTRSFSKVKVISDYVHKLSL